MPSRAWGGRSRAPRTHSGATGCSGRTGWRRCWKRPPSSCPAWSRIAGRQRPAPAQGPGRGGDRRGGSGCAGRLWLARPVGTVARRARRLPGARSRLPPAAEGGAGGVGTPRKADGPTRPGGGRAAPLPSGPGLAAGGGGGSGGGFGAATDPRRVIVIGGAFLIRPPTLRSSTKQASSRSSIIARCRAWGPIKTTLITRRYHSGGRGWSVRAQEAHRTQSLSFRHPDFRACVPLAAYIADSAMYVPPTGTTAVISG